MLLRVCSLGVVMEESRMSIAAPNNLGRVEEVVAGLINCKVID